MNLYIVIALCAALFMGWCMGPFVEWLGNKVSNSKSAKESERIATLRYDKNANGFDKTNNDWFNPVEDADRNVFIFYVFVFVFFSSIIGFIITFHIYFIYSILVCFLYFYFHKPPYLIPPSR